MFQRGTNVQLERLRSVGRQSRSGATPTPPVALTDGMVGGVEIRRLGLSALVIEGSGPNILRRAVGHIPGTSLQGQPGNTGISGHRDTFFRPLRNIRSDDIITVITPTGEYRYRVIYTSVAGRFDGAILDRS